MPAGVLAAVIAYNWTEAAFKGLDPVFFVLFIIALQYRRAKRSGYQRPEPVYLESDEELVYAKGDIGADSSDL